MMAYPFVVYDKHKELVKELEKLNLIVEDFDVDMLGKVTLKCIIKDWKLKVK